MIENLLKGSARRLKQEQKSNPFQNEIPLWLQCESSMVPPEYKYFWSLVQSNVDLADTQKVSQLLLTSGLQVEVLGFIWNLANKTIPGQLTKQEFYIVLALVFLAQKGFKYDNLGVLKSMSAPSIPALQVNFFTNQFSGVNKMSYHSHQIPTSSNFNLGSEPLTTNNFNSSLVTTSNSLYVNTNITEKLDTLGTSCKQPRNEKRVENTQNKSDVTSNGILGSSDVFNKFNTHNHNTQSNTNFPCIGSSPTSELENEFSEFQSVPINNSTDLPKDNFGDSNDEFTDFQSASSETAIPSDPYETVVISQKREIPKIPLPKSLVGKLNNLKSNILKISPESERKLKVLSSSESLSSLPESKISSTNQVSTSLSVLGSNHGIGSRLANHSLSKIFNFKNFLTPFFSKFVYLNLLYYILQNLIIHN